MNTQKHMNSTTDKFWIADVETLKILSNPLRLQLIEQIQRVNQNGRFATAKQLAEQLDTSLTKLYYHLKLLEKCGVLEAAETILVSGIPEKQYRLTAKRISVAEDIFDRSADHAETSDALLEIIHSILDNTRHALTRLTAKHNHDELPSALKQVDLHFSRETRRLSIAQARNFHAELKALVQKYEQIEPEDDAEEQFSFGLTTLFYPDL